MKTLLPTAVLALAALSLQAGPMKPGQVSKEANWYVHADLETLRGTEAGKTVMAAIEDEHGRQLKAVKRMFSLNPITDLHGVTLYGNGEKDKGVVLIHGEFDREHLTDLIGGAEDYKSSTHRDDTLHTWKDDGKGQKDGKVQHGAFYGEDLVIISDHKALVTHALDVLHGRKRAMDLDPGLPSSPPAVLIGVANLEGIDLRGDDAKIVEKARSLQMRLFEEGERINAELVINTTNNDDAVRMQKVLDGIVALGQLTDDNLAGLDIEMKTSVTEDTKMTARLSVPTRQFLELADEAGKLGKFMD